MGWFSNIANSISNAWSGAKQFVSDAYGKVKDVSAGIKSGFDWVGSTLDKASNYVANIPYIGGAAQGVLDELKTVYKPIQSEIDTINDQIQNPEYAHLGSQLGDLGDQIVSGIETGANWIDQRVNG